MKENASNLAHPLWCSALPCDVYAGSDQKYAERKRRKEYRTARKVFPRRRELNIARKKRRSIKRKQSPCLGSFYENLFCGSGCNLPRAPARIKERPLSSASQRATSFPDSIVCLTTVTPGVLRIIKPWQIARARKGNYVETNVFENSTQSDVCVSLESALAESTINL